MGGLARRVSYEKLFRKNLAQVPLLIVESGDFMTDEHNTHGELRPDASIKDEWIMKAYDQFPADVINISSHDLRYISRLLQKSGTAGKAETQPMLKRLVSANITSISPDKIAPQPFVIREVPGRQSAKPVRVAFVGLTETGVAAPRGFKFTDVLETARRVVPEARKRADVVIAVAYFKSEDAQRLASEVPDIDAIITGNSQSDGAFFFPPLTVGKTLIVFTAYETRMMGELLFYRDAQGKFSVRARYISLDTEVPDDPAALQVVNAAREAEEGMREKSKTLLLGWLETTRRRKPAGESATAYTSSSACAQCHMAQYIKWSNSKHAHATDPLVSRQFEFEASCLNCHATAQLKANAAELTKMQQVQCEQCHGPGGDHAAKPGKGYGRITNIQAVCSDCHTQDTSPNFNAQTAWEKIKH
ncbi:MAG TPA: multiheme c-type cytochrome [Blastocatellia bacterium]|nr:multiheme c-type cytochrome [Blastocatellia bacterium]